MKLSFASNLSKAVLTITLTSCLLVGSSATAEAAVKPSAKVKEAQTIMTKFGIPTGTIDGEFGPNTARGLCAFRQISGDTWSRKALNNALLKKLRAYDTKYSKLSSAQSQRQTKTDTTPT